MQHLQRAARFDITVVTPAEGPLRGDLEAAGVVVKIAPIPFDDLSAYEENLAQIAGWAAGNFDVVLAFTLTSFAGIDLAWRLGLLSVWRIGESESVATVVDWLNGRIDPAVERRADSSFDLASVVLFIRKLLCARVGKEAPRDASSWTEMESMWQRPAPTCKRPIVTSAVETLESATSNAS